MHSRIRERPSEHVTPTQRLASILLGQDVQTWIDVKRSEGRAWRLIARDLYEITNGQIDVTHETLRGWGRGAA